jgi:hypothetical protein
MLSFVVIISPPFQPGSLGARNQVGKRLLYRPASAGVLEQSMGGKELGLSYQPAWLHRLAEPIPGILKIIKTQSQAT